jgi:hypothetical protein
MMAAGVAVGLTVIGLGVAVVAVVVARRRQ